MSEILLPKPVGSSQSALIRILFLDIYNTLLHIICSLIDRVGQKKMEFSIFIMGRYSWNYEIQIQISNYSTNNAVLFSL